MCQKILSEGPGPGPEVIELFSCSTEHKTTAHKS